MTTKTDLLTEEALTYALVMLGKPAKERVLAHDAALRADNAALVEALGGIVRRAAHPEDKTPRPMLTLIEDASLVLLKSHPGAEVLALLQRRAEALEWVIAYLKRGGDVAALMTLEQLLSPPK